MNNRTKRLLSLRELETQEQPIDQSFLESMQYVSLKNEKTDFSSFLKCYILSLFILILPPLGINFVFLKNSGEFLSPKEVFFQQNGAGYKKVLYGSALFSWYFREIKLHALKMKKPKIIAFGSSRVLQFRESFFSKSFYNMGLMASSVREAKDSAEKILHSYHPEVVLLGVDFWWFRQKSDYVDKNTIVPENNKLRSSHLVLPIMWLYSKRVNLTNYIKIVLNIANTPHIAVNAKIKNEGYAPDGSYYYTNRVLVGEEESFPNNIEPTKDLINKGISMWGHESLASDLHFLEFLEVIKMFENKGSRVILFFPPIMPLIKAEMERYDYSYILNLKEKFREKGIRVYDFTNPTDLLITNDCEFLDTSHGGDVLYSKIIEFISLHEPFLHPYVQHDYLRSVIDKYSGLSMIPDPSVTDGQEVDFLCIGCRKVNHSLTPQKTSK